jgi:hypothetical protein
MSSRNKKTRKHNRFYGERNKRDHFAATMPLPVYSKRAASLGGPTIPPGKQVHTETSYGIGYSYGLDCHAGTPFVFSDPVSGIRFYGGSTRLGVEYEPNDLLVILNRSKPCSPISASFEVPKSLQNSVDWIEIEWVDYQPSTLTKEQWLNIVELFRNRKQNVVIYCTGGHGRTGTALAILAYLMGVIPKYDDPVKWIRDHYCEECVETKSQIAYIEKITGARVFQTADHGNFQGNHYSKVYPPFQ